MRHLLLTTSLFASFFAVSGLQAAELSKADIEKIIHEYIMANPQVMIDSVNAYEVKLQSEQQEQAMSVVRDNADWIYNNPNHAVAGNPNGDVTIVEFFDYNCGYCKQALTDLMTLIDEDKNIKVVFIDLPILGESSTLAARWSKAAQAQGKFLEFHVPLMRHRGALNDSVLENYAQAAGMDVAKAKTFMLSSDVTARLDDNTAKSQSFGIAGTPAFILGDKMVRGYVGIDGMRKVVAEVREEAKKKK